MVFETLRRLVRDALEITRLPRLDVDLMHRETLGNHPFYSWAVREFHAKARRRHPKFPLVRQLEHGVAVGPLPPTIDDYLAHIEPAGRRNVRKAARLGYVFQRIDVNAYLDDVRAIEASTDVRQGRAYVGPPISRCTDPPSRTNVHDYPYFGVLHDGRLVAFAGCFVAGEVCLISTILGHADHLQSGVVPQLIVGVAGYTLERYPRVRYYVYGTYFGAGTTMRRFKAKFGFAPHRVRWHIDRAAPTASGTASR